MKTMQLRTYTRLSLAVLLALALVAMLPIGVVMADEVESNAAAEVDAVTPMALQVTNLTITRTSSTQLPIEFDCDGDVDMYFTYQWNGEQPMGAFMRYAPVGHNSFTFSGVYFFSTADSIMLTACDWSSSISIIVFQDTYPIPAWVPPTDTKDITAFALAGASGTITGTNITVTVPYGTDITALTPAITHTGASVSPTGAQDYTDPVTYTVTAQDGSTKDYTVTVTVGTAIAATGFGTWTGTETMKGIVEADMAGFIRLSLGGVAVDPADYTVSVGSTVITLADSYLKTLANGDYVFTAEFEDGSATLPLTVAVRPTTAPPRPGGTLPATGDSAAATLPTALLLAISGCMLLRTTYRRKACRVTGSCNLTCEPMTHLIWHTAPPCVKLHDPVAHKLYPSLSHSEPSHACHY